MDKGKVLYEKNDARMGAKAEADRRDTTYRLRGVCSFLRTNRIRILQLPEFARVA